jgi:hypothetical protein
MTCDECKEVIVSGSLCDRCAELVELRQRVQELEAERGELDEAHTAAVNRADEATQIVKKLRFERDNLRAFLSNSLALVHGQAEAMTEGEPLSSYIIQSFAAIERTAKLAKEGKYLAHIEHYRQTGQMLDN